MKPRILAFGVVSFVLGAVFGVVVLTSTVLRTTWSMPSQSPTVPTPPQLPRGAVPFEFNGGTYYHVPLLATER